MKKTLLLIAALLAIGTAAAQDTIELNGPKPNYFSNYWPTTDTLQSSGFEGVFSWSHLEYNYYNSLINAKYCFTEDSLRIYGVAVMLGINSKEVIASRVEDTTTTASYEHFSIYRAGSEHPEPYSDSLMIHFFNTPPTYYLRMVIVDPNYDYPDPRHVEVHPVWEAYFKEPYMVKDSFYLAATSTSFTHNFHTDATNHFIYDHWPVTVTCFLPSYRNFDFMTQPWPEKMCSYSAKHWCWVCDSMPNVLFFFPILTPDSTWIDTTIVDTTVVDTVGIAMQRMLERYVGVQPNPATERAQVVSSFGLSAVELYNAAGAKVAEQPATGYSASLDVSTLPPGPYLVRITTPSGKVTKKLVVQRR